ncbi:SH3 domain-containing protein [Azospirillum sp. SYSU D00513]|uniref:SH3 domain-containing protein n=1 Tax=Azospirillum sp. SYSU D00513 TaxID=2812561 RepID=UPI001A979321|nr:SH3 domain-containing protein [Azospirillum sp. SYSU D00513]
MSTFRLPLALALALAGAAVGASGASAATPATQPAQAAAAPAAPPAAPAAAPESGGKAPDKADKSPVHGTGLPLPRFVTLRSNEVNARSGPGVRYPVEWVFVRKEMPVEITAEFDTWRRIRDWEGSEGWVHQSMLSGKRSIMIRGETRTILKEARDGAPAVARAEPGVMGWLQRCQGPWCEVNLQGYKGWLPRDAFWGVYENEVVE